MSGRQLINGTAWSLAGQAITIVASGAFTPFVVRKMGPTSYGILAFFNLLINYLAYADIGMGTTSTRFAAQEECRRNPTRESQVIWAAVALSTAMGLLVATLIIVGAPTISDHILHLKSPLRAEGITGFRIIGAAFLLKNIAAVLNTPQLVRLQFSTYSAITYGAVLVQLVSTPIVLGMGGNLIAVAGTIAAINLFILVMHFRIGLRLLPQLWPPPRIRIEVAKPLLTFGVTLVVSQLPDLILLNAERILLTYYSSVANLAYYSVAYTYASLSVLAAIASAQVLIPMFSRLQSSTDREYLRHLYCRSVVFLCLALAPIAVLLAVAARPVLITWAGHDYGQHSIAACYVLLVGLVFHGLANVPASLLVAVDRVGLLGRFRSYELPPYLIAVAVLTSRFGILGAATTWSIRAIGDAIVLFVAAERIEKVRYRRGVLSSGCGVLALLLPPLIVLVLKPAEWFWIPTATLISICIYAFFVWRTILTNPERAWLVLTSRRGMELLSFVRVPN